MAEILAYPGPAGITTDGPLQDFIGKLESTVELMNDVQRRAPNREAELLALIYSWAAAELRDVPAPDDRIVDPILRLVQALPSSTGGAHT